MSICYLRRPGQSWQPATLPYTRLLHLYEELRPSPLEPITLCTTAEDGSIIMAQLQPKPHVAGVYLCQLDGPDGVMGVVGGVVELMRGPRALGER